MFSAGILILFVCLNIQSVSGQYQDISHVISHIQDGYRKDVLPTRTSTSYVGIKVYPAIVRIEDLDAEQEELFSTISLSLFWTDERLTWDPRDYGGVTEVHVPASSIWLPDITVHNTLSPPEDFKDQLVEVSSLGHVLYVKNVHARSYCHVDLTWFPRDQHTCELIFSSWIYPSQKVMMEFMHVNTSSTAVPVLADTDPNVINLDGHKWHLRGRKASAEINLLTYSCCLDESYVQLKIALTLRRNFSLLADMFILPMLVISVLVPFQFLLPSKSSSRPAFGLLLVFGELLPLAALCLYVPAFTKFPFIGVVNVWCLVSAACALILSIISTNIGNISRRPLPLCLILFLRRVPLLSQKRNTETKFEKAFKRNNISESEGNGILPHGDIEMEHLGTCDETSRLTNEINGLTNEPNGVVNGINCRMTNNLNSVDNRDAVSALLDILTELKHLRSITNGILEGKDKPDWLSFATFLNFVFFLVFLVLFIVEVAILCLSL